jgi:predicted metal-dependent phosphotriesterase family hydrolase
MEKEIIHVADAYAITHAVPMLMEAGVSLQRINKYLMDNPRRFFDTG